MPLTLPSPEGEGPGGEAARTVETGEAAKLLKRVKQ